MASTLLKNGTLVNEEQITETDLRIKNGRIEKIAKSISPSPSDTVIDCSGLHILPGLIDDQVHFREPGFTHKGDIFTESRAAVAGGVTSFMEMPNTHPSTTTRAALQNKLDSANGRSWANYAFFFGASNQNLEEVLAVDPHKTCGIKVFMGSSTGDMLVDDSVVLENIFKSTPLVIATHCEDEKTVRYNLERARNRFGTAIPFSEHPNIRSRDACFLSSSLAISLAQKHSAQLHILHLTTFEELALFQAGSMQNKKITAEACVHHLHFESFDYERLGGLIKCNPAIKLKTDREALWAAIADDRIDIIATDHAPHTWAEKQNPYETCPSGLPLVQHSLSLMLNAVKQSKISLQKLVRKMCHNPAERFQVVERGYLREGYWADLALVDLNKNQTISKNEVLYHVGWSPLEGEILKGENIRTFVNGECVFGNGKIRLSPIGQPLTFNRH